MRRNRDPRINAGYVSIKEYLLLVLTQVVLSALYMALIRFFIEQRIVETNMQFVLNVIRVNILMTALLIMVIMSIFRHISWSRPIRAFGEAAKNVAMGDFSVRIPPLRKDGKKDFIEVMFDDFNTMVHELASIETMKNDFIANVSHEIKTPLAIIQSYAATLQNDTLQAEERREYTQTIIEASQKLSLLVTNILKLNKLENQKIIPKAESYKLSEQIRQCAVSFADQWEQKNINLEVDLDEVYVCYDENMLEIVWNNLISNAIKFTPKNGKIFISLKVHDDSTQNFVSVYFTDTGCGIDEATQKHIFDKFFQGDTSHADEGNGLGLALVKKTIELLGGKISVDSVLGHGSTFTVYLNI